MSDTELFEYVKNNNIEKVKGLITGGIDLNSRDDYGWTPLNWAAGRGNLEMVRLLVESGADVLNRGYDKRTPYEIALAAGHGKVADYFQAVIEKSNKEIMDNIEKKRLYCRAYFVRALREFDPTLFSGDLKDEDLAFLHEDYTVTKAFWPNENIIFNQITPQWIEFCKNHLKFKIPAEFDLIP